MSTPQRAPQTISTLSRVFIFGFMVWTVIGSLFRLFVMTIRNQPYDALPVVTIALVITGFFILSLDRSTPHE